MVPAYAELFPAYAGMVPAYAFLGNFVKFFIPQSIILKKQVPSNRLLS
jgi:hypothetical protein